MRLMCLTYQTSSLSLACLKRAGNTNAGDTLHSRVLVLYTCGHVPDWELLQHHEGFVPHITSREKIKIRNMVSIERVLLSHHRTVEKL